MFSIHNRFVYMILLGLYSFLNTLLVEAFDHYPISTPKSVILALFVLVVIGIWEGNRIWDNFISEKNIKEFWKRIAYNFTGSILITSFITLVLGGIVCYLTISSRWQDWVLSMKLFLMVCFRINLFLNTIHIIYLYHLQLEHSYKEVENYKKISTQAQLQSLKNQVNPHFLFNNLSVLSALIPTDANASVEFVRQFSRVYRYLLKSHEKEIIELSEELNFIESYLYLLKTRFQTGLVINIQISPSGLSAYIVPVSLQMLVENAIKHNVIAKSKPLHIDIFSVDGVSVTVKNNLQRKIVDEEESTKLGLSNISKRYEFLGQKGILIEENDEQFSVTIPLIRLKKPAFSSEIERID
ncbi:sensor histidine kinase [Runella salmonicolor]|uniref:Histidine kinase n=1 Tax=Runella salmonicolor TaxID=2950278 RepID=A0ABT1FXS0_9BACT|nr:histidine kinase [Runella salmonicolor]MCP1386270.1 histidine kinase [Runella salmonicolor]